jgi:glycine oxidase
VEREKTVDIIIVGQGIAGTVLAHELLARGKSILVIDKPELSACSRISAGMYNPVVFKRLTQSWMADELIATLKPFYERVGQLLGKELLFGREIIKIFSEEQERSFWEKKMKEQVGKYLQAVSDEPIPEFGATPFGYGSVTEAGYLDVQNFLSLSASLFSSKGMLLNERFDHSAMDLSGEGVVYTNVNARHIIFCQGYRGSENPYFQFVPFNPAKGELLTVKMEDYHFEKVINKTVFIAPLGDKLFRVGSTFKWDNINDETTENAKEELVENLKKVTTKEFEIMDHKAGVRPAVDDRRPVIGLHPDHKQLGIFNGMGSKGVMLSPYFSKELCGHLFEGKALNKEADINRLRKK